MAARLTAYLVALIVATTFIVGLIVGAQRDDEGPVDLIVLNGHVYTAGGPESGAEAIAVQGNKILRVGTTREVQRLRRAQTVVIDANGGAILPGFNDAHLHLLNDGLGLAGIDLLDARTLPEIEEAIRGFATTHPDREWLTGRGWYYESFAGGMPTRQLLDTLITDRPAFLTSYDGHTGWANSRALKLAGITRRTPNPANGTIVKDARTGEPTGALKEAAMAIMTPLMPELTRDERAAAVRAAMTEAHRRGVTSVFDASGSADDLEVYNELRRQNDLQLRVYAGLSAGLDVSVDQIDAFEQLRTKYSDDPLFKTGAIQLMVDGAIPAHTAAMLEPYSDRASVRGAPWADADTLNRLVAALDARGWQIAIHAVGDRAVRMSLDAFELAAEQNPAPARGRRHRIEHIEVADPDDVPRFGRLGVVASMMPYHGVPDPSRIAAWSANVGAERAARGWAYNSIAKTGGVLAFGSDWPFGNIDPILGLHVAVNRTTPAGEPDDGWQAAERVKLNQAIDAYTRNAAWASFDEHRKGTLERDMLADIVILSKDIFALPTDRLSEAEVAVTIFDGKVVYQRSSETN